MLLLFQGRSSVSCLEHKLKKFVVQDLVQSQINLRVVLGHILQSIDQPFYYSKRSWCHLHLGCPAFRSSEVLLVTCDAICGKAFVCVSWAANFKVWWCMYYTYQTNGAHIIHSFCGSHCRRYLYQLYDQENLFRRLKLPLWVIICFWEWVFVYLEKANIGVWKFKLLDMERIFWNKFLKLAGIFLNFSIP
jgi:hypothetical protein